MVGAKRARPHRQGRWNLASLVNMAAPHITRVSLGLAIRRATQAPLAKFHEIVEVHQVLSSLRHTFESATLKADARSGTFEASGGNIDG